VLVECSVLFAIAFPAIGIQSAVDVNERLGTVISESGTRRVLASERRTSGSGKHRRTRYTFTLDRGAPIGGHEIPTSIRVPYSLYSEVEKGERVEVTVSRGSLGLDWIELRAAPSAGAG
jgi:hypothetical protein